MTDIVKEALANWNGVKGDTGWEFVDGGTEADHDIRIKVGKIDDEAGGAETTGFSAKDATTKRVKELVIISDPEPKEGFKWDTAGTSKDDTKNPVSNLKHELSHTLRLDHQKGSDVGSTDDKGLRSQTKIIKQPQGSVTKDDDVLTISAKDKEEAKKASTAPIKVASVGGGPGSSASLTVPGFADETSNAALIALRIPGTAFFVNTDVSLSRTSLRSMPDPFNTPMGIDRMVKGENIVLTSNTGQPMLQPNQFFDTSIPYEEIGIDIADPEYRQVFEASLRPFYYNPQTLSWTLLDPVALGGTYLLDMANNIVSMSLPTDFLTQFSVPGATDSTFLFLSIAGNPVPEPSNLGLVVAALAAGLGTATARRGRQTKSKASSAMATPTRL